MSNGNARVVKMRDITLYTAKPPAFTERGACVGILDVEWLPEDTEPTATARAICRTCPVRAECLAYALEHNSPGIMGGTTEAERRQIRREARK
jgi:WhiB family redox-sensing transcriptional regulator